MLELKLAGWRVTNDLYGEGTDWKWLKCIKLHNAASGGFLFTYRLQQIEP